MGKCVLYIIVAILLSGCSSFPPQDFIVKLTLPSKVPAMLPIAMTSKQHIVYSFSKDLDIFATTSYEEASRRFKDPVVIIGHGQDDLLNNKWTLWADEDRGGKMVVEELALEMARRFPDRDIIFFTCNENNQRINVPRVWYFTNIVWAVSDIDSLAIEAKKKPLELIVHKIFTGRENTRGAGYAGSIWEATIGNMELEYVTKK